MKKILIPVLALVLLFVPINSLNAGTIQEQARSANPRVILSGETIRYFNIAIKDYCRNIQLPGKDDAQTSITKVPTIHIYNLKNGTWNKVTPSTSTPVNKPSGPEPGSAEKTTPVQTTPNAAPVPVPTPASEPVNPASETDDFSALQREMLGYINTARAEANLPALSLNEKLCQGAYLKSKDMAVNNYFSHTSPNYGSPFEMMTAQGVSYRAAGENIAKNVSVKGAHDAFMNSPGHKANILSQRFNKIGLGFYQQGRYLYVTQWFTN